MNSTGHNSGFKKLAVQWLIEHSTSHQHLWWLDSFVLRNPPERKARKRWQQVKKLPLQATYSDLKASDMKNARL